jgi:hypothetical protein
MVRDGSQEARFVGGKTIRSPRRCVMNVERSRWLDDIGQNMRRSLPATKPRPAVVVRHHVFRQKTATNRSRLHIPSLVTRLLAAALSAAAHLAIIRLFM